MTQEPIPRRGVSGGTILLAVVICCLFAWILAQGGCWTLGMGGRSMLHSMFLPLWIMTLLHLGLAVYVGIDAERRGMQGVLWGALVFFTSIVGLVVYLIVCTGAFDGKPGGTVHRSEAVGPGPGQAVCGSCRSPVAPDYKVCPFCGEDLKRSCDGCGKPLQSGWKVCPYCGKGTGTGT